MITCRYFVYFNKFNCKNWSCYCLFTIFFVINFRYVVTAVSSWKTSVDNGYWIWTFQGRILKRVNLNAFNQLLWRPRPPTLLTAEQIKEIKKNLKKYSAQFESKDRMRLTRASKVSQLFMLNISLSFNIRNFFHYIIFF